MVGFVRPLGRADEGRVRRLLGDQLENVFLNSRLDAGILTHPQPSYKLLGWQERGHIVSVCYVGANIVPVGASPQALDAFVEQLGPRRNSASIMGVSDQTLGLYERLASRWGKAWKTAREIRPHQPLMALRASAIPGSIFPPELAIISPDERVHGVGPTITDAYFRAAVAMYTEEVGVPPADKSYGYKNHVNNLIVTGRAFGAYDAQRKSVWFKADIGCAHDDACQIQGVWLDPALRGQRLAVPAMAQVGRLCLRKYSTVTLYVNDFNIRARRLYERVGFRTVSEFATVLY